MNTYRLYAKFPGQTRFAPVNWREGKQVVNLIYASLFLENEIEDLRRELSLPENTHITFRIQRAN